MGLSRFVSRVFGSRRSPESEMQERTSSFREILHANNAALGLIARIQQALAGETRVGAGEVRRLVTGVTLQTFRMVVNLGNLTGKRQRAIRRRFDAIREQIVRRIEVTPVLVHLGPVVPLEQVDATLAEAVGQKSAFLGEARKTVGDHVPVGLATTVDAFRAFMGEGNLGQRIQDLLGASDLTDVSTCFRACAQVRALVESAPVPEALEKALTVAVAALPGGDSLRLAVRSSALQEGGLELSFAGQYRSLLNVPRQRVVEAFKQVIASKYSPQAVTYRLGRGFDDSEIGMCCCIIPMVDARAAGVLYSACRTPDGVRTLVQAVRGLGLAAVDGSAEPDSYWIVPGERAPARRKLGAQRDLLRVTAGEGTEKVSVEPGATGAILTDDEVVAVADLAWRIERALGTPIDMEWAVDREGRAWVLQVRPQPEHADEDVSTSGEPLPGIRLLHSGGTRASRGAGCGPVVHLETDLDMLRCPPGAILVTREANPRFATLLPKAVGIVSDMGETTSHLATVARELRVPALFATRSAFDTLPQGALVTLDADGGLVYEGRVEALLVVPEREVLPRDANRELLESVADLIVPLTLRGRLASGFAPRRCKTIHDVIRYCHQATIEAMFQLGDRASRDGHAVRRLVSKVPIDCRIIDLGGGLREGVGAELGIDEVVSIPMRALWAGMTDTRLAWNAARPVSAKGFVTSMVNFGYDEDAGVRQMGEPSYAFVTAEYLSLNSRIGYHFSTVDARVGPEGDRNHLSFRFVGGSTSVTQRSRRATLIERLLQRNGFETDCRVDLVNARVRRLPQAEMEDKLRTLGLLIEFVNHLDMALTSDAIAADYEQAFLAGDYGFHRGGHA